MLTPAEISGKEFEKVFFSGYDMTGVDDFLELVTADYTALYKENGILKNKLKVLVEKIEEYRSTEDAMRMALLTAQKMGDSLIAEAEHRKAEMLSELETTAESRRAELDAMLGDEKARLDAAVAERERFVEASKEVIGSYLDFLSKLGSVRREPAPPASAPTREERISSAAREIDSAVEKLVKDGDKQRADETVTIETAPSGGEQIELSEPDDEGDPTRTYIPKSVQEELEETSPRPKFDFDNLKFGVNFEDS